MSCCRFCLFSLDNITVVCVNTALLFENIERHVQLTEKEKAIILEAAQERKVKKGQYLVHEGTVARSTNFVTQGAVHTHFNDLEGKAHLVQFAVEGWWISDLKSFIQQKPARFNVQALEDATVIEFLYEPLEQLYMQVPKMERFFRIITINGFISFQERIVQNLSMTVEERYLAFHEKYAKLELRFPQKMIAEYLGVSAEFLSKVKKRLAEKEMGK